MKTVLISLVMGALWAIPVSSLLFEEVGNSLVGTQVVPDKLRSAAFRPIICCKDRLSPILRQKGDMDRGYEEEGRKDDSSIICCKKPKD